MIFWKALCFYELARLSYGRCLNISEIFTTLLSYFETGLICSEGKLFAKSFSKRPLYSDTRLLKTLFGLHDVSSVGLKGASPDIFDLDAISSSSESSLAATLCLLFLNLL